MVMVETWDLLCAAGLLQTPFSSNIPFCTAKDSTPITIRASASKDLVTKHMLARNVDKLDPLCLCFLGIGVVALPGLSRLVHPC